MHSIVKKKILAAKVNRWRSKNQSKFSEVFDTPDGKTLWAISEDGMGGIELIFFFNKDGKFLKQYTFDPAISSNILMNGQETYFVLSSFSDDEFYFFDLKGNLIRKGKFNEITKLYMHNIGSANIGKTGKVWLIGNEDTYIYNRKSELIDVMPGGFMNSYIDEDKNVIVYTTMTRIIVYNYILKKRIYECRLVNTNRLHIEGKYLYIRYKGNPNEYRYEFKL